MIRTLTLAGLLSLGLATAALADPCKAIPDRGPMPGDLHSGARFSGPVVYVGDGDSLCVGVGSKPDAWVEVRLADFYAPELHEPGGQATKAALERIAMGQRADCVAGHQSHDRVVARCEIAGRSLLGDLMRGGRRSGGRESISRRQQRRRQRRAYHRHERLISCVGCDRRNLPELRRRTRRRGRANVSRRPRI